MFHSCTVSKIYSVSSQKLQIFTTSHRGVPIEIGYQHLGVNKLEWWGYQAKKDIFSHLDAIHESDRLTDTHQPSAIMERRSVKTTLSTISHCQHTMHNKCDVGRVNNIKRPSTTVTATHGLVKYPAKAKASIQHLQVQREAFWLWQQEMKECNLWMVRYTPSILTAIFPGGPGPECLHSGFYWSI